jgi:hypothetical protein
LYVKGDKLIRSGHFLYDLREMLGSPQILVGLLVVASIFILFISFQFVYVFVLLFGTMITLRGLIGRRCPKCDGPLKEVGAERDKENAFIMYIIWRCPRDGYEEKEKTKGDAGLFGTG